MTVKFYFDLISQPARALLLFLRRAGIPHEECGIQLRKGEHLTDSFKKLNPMGQVPAISHNGFVLSESVAIFQYLTREFKIQDHWYPQDSQHRALVDQFLCWQSGNLRVNGLHYFQSKVIIPRQTGEKPNEEKLKLHESDLRKNLETMEAHFFDGKRLGGKELCYTDLIALCELLQPWAAGLDVFSNYPKISAWMEETKSKLQPDFDDLHQIIYKIRSSQVK